jgi:vacuolar protein sorting-associated protein 45
LTKEFNKWNVPE